ncbi:aspartate/glutamate racemase family protein [Paracoccus ravus]|uniref:aspartate/glutamate racemase family protein n=1 Tax=Paracoccus ravus TaxID=2447760 RepID=UPI00106EC52E|nr:aspartate/glutamate racemase family protein [Paracoccus ravus]
MIALLNPNRSAQVTAAMVGIAQETCPDIAVTGLTADFGAALITDPKALATGAKAALQMARALPFAARGIIVAAFGDPGLDDIRGGLDLPVTGIGEASFLEASAGGRRYAIATTTPLLDAAIRARVEASGTGSAFMGCFYTQGDPAELTSRPERLSEALAETIHMAIENGAEAVIVGGGPLALAARALAPDFNVPIIEPVPAAMRRMRLLLGL